jgi:hypothetical protein
MRYLMKLVAVVALAFTLMTPAGANEISNQASNDARLQVIAMFLPGNPAGTGASSVLKVQGYECRACRRACSRDYKWDCEGSEGWCRRQFVRCMRDCWEELCR